MPPNFLISKVRITTPFLPTSRTAETIQCDKHRSGFLKLCKYLWRLLVNFLFSFHSISILCGLFTSSDFQKGFEAIVSAIYLSKMVRIQFNKYWSPVILTLLSTCYALGAAQIISLKPHTKHLRGIFLFTFSWRSMYWGLWLLNNLIQVGSYGVQI